MELGLVGLGRMGANMARRLLRAGHACVVLDRDPGAVATLVAEGARGTDTVAALVAGLAAPRHVWLMLPAGAPTEAVIAELAAALAPGDTIIDGGNTYFKDDVRRAAALAARGLHHVDVGTSGGVAGLERGYCLMIGGAPEVVARLVPVFQALAPGRGAVARTPGAAGGSAEDGYLHCGPAGAGHYAKMVHNGIEYGIMQALAEGFDLLRGAPGYELPLPAIAEVWRRGSVLSSWLVDLTARALAEDPGLARYAGHVADSGEGRWAALTAIEQGVPAEVITTALYARFRSRQDPSFADQLLSALRHQFGGHAEPPPDA